MTTNTEATLDKLEKTLTFLSKKAIATWYGGTPDQGGYYAGWDDAEYWVREALALIPTLRSQLVTLKRAILQITEPSVIRPNSDQEVVHPRLTLKMDREEFHQPCETPFSHLTKFSALGDYIFHQLESGLNAKVHTHNNRFVITLDNPAYLRNIARSVLSKPPGDATEREGV